MGLGKTIWCHLIKAIDFLNFRNFVDSCQWTTLKWAWRLEAHGIWRAYGVPSSTLVLKWEHEKMTSYLLFPFTPPYISCISYISEHAPVNPLISYDVSLLQFSEDNRKTSYESFLFKTFTKGGTWLSKCEFACCSRLGYKGGDHEGFLLSAPVEHVIT